MSVFGSEAVPWSLAWPDAHGSPTRCGPFDINIAYVQGNRAQSRLTPEAWGAITAKLERYSGLYIYRDGIRVLPYGNSDFDFLNFERQRSKSASDYFFSYRRIFGVIELTRATTKDCAKRLDVKVSHQTNPTVSFATCSVRSSTRWRLTSFAMTDPRRYVSNSALRTRAVGQSAPPACTAGS